MLYENFTDENQAGVPTGQTSQFDFLRAILYAGYRFNDKFLFNSEIEIEHADEVFVEFAYVDYLANDNLGIRGGLLLLPMGLVSGHGHGSAPPPSSQKKDPPCPTSKFNT